MQLHVTRVKLRENKALLHLLRSTIDERGAFVAEYSSRLTKAATDLVSVERSKLPDLRVLALRRFHGAERLCAWNNNRTHDQGKDHQRAHAAHRQQGWPLQREGAGRGEKEALLALTEMDANTVASFAGWLPLKLAMINNQSCAVVATILDAVKLSSLTSLNLRGCRLEGGGGALQST